MTLSSESSRERCILATVVLYGRAPSESQSFCSLLRILGANPDLAKRFSIILYDNSPDPHVIEAEVNIPIAYIHQPKNTGLAGAYNFALARAEEHRQEWLLLLDQDTTLSYEFLTELIERVVNLRDQYQVASIVPRLIAGDKLFSPEPNLIYQIRHQSRRLYNIARRNPADIEEVRLVAYNSGATFRVSALRSIGGFPEEFWLDYLDHAVCHALSAQNYSMHVMHAEIEHEPSMANLGEVPEWRMRNILLAQTLFVKKTGNFFDRLLYRIWVLRQSRSLWIRSPHRRLWKEALIHALLLNTGKPHGA